MASITWRTATDLEWSLVTSWVAAWNATYGGHVEVPAILEARASCSCGTCPSFAVRALVLESEHTDNRPLAIEGDVSNTDGTVVAGLIAFSVSVDEVDFEIYPLGFVDVTTLDGLSFALSAVNV